MEARGLIYQYHGDWPSGMLIACKEAIIPHFYSMHAVTHTFPTMAVPCIMPPAVLVDLI